MKKTMRNCSVHVFQRYKKSSSNINKTSIDEGLFRLSLWYHEKKTRLASTFKIMHFLGFFLNPRNPKRGGNEDIYN